MISMDGKTLLTAVAASSLLAAGGGALVGKALFAGPARQASAAKPEDDHADEKPRVDMPPERIAADGVQVLVLADGGLDAAVPAQATVVAMPHGAAILAARADGAAQGRKGRHRRWARHRKKPRPIAGHGLACRTGPP